MNIRTGDAGLTVPAARRAGTGLRWTLLGAVVLVLVQSAAGMVVNLYVTVPSRHPGARPSNYLSGSFHSVTWAISAGQVALACHAALGLALVVFAIAAVVHAVRSRRRAVTFWSVAGGLLVIGAGFNGASFLDFNHNASSLIMALLAFAAAGSYATALFLSVGGKDLPSTDGGQGGHLRLGRHHDTVALHRPRAAVADGVRETLPGGRRGRGGRGRLRGRT
jgi:hypothetical protein